MESNILSWVGHPVIGDFFSQTWLQSLLNTWGYLAVTIFILIECTGIPCPGETMLVFASFYAGTTGRLSLLGIIIASTIGAIVGDNLGYLIGRFGGRPLMQRLGRFIGVGERPLAAAETFFARHGNKTVFWGRFVAILRTWAALLAGINRMRWTMFLAYNVAGGVAWSICFGLLGYLLGRFLGVHFSLINQLTQGLGYLLLGTIGISILVWLIRTRLYQRKRMVNEPRNT